MKKKVFLIIALVLAVACIAVVIIYFATKKDVVEAIVLKNEYIVNEYFVGEEFNPTDAVLVVKYEGKDGYKNVGLTEKGVIITGFSTAEVKTGAIATISFGGKSINFTYSVKLRDMPQWQVTGAGTFTYDGTEHTIGVTGVPEGSTITVVKDNMTRTPFISQTDACEEGISLIVTVAKNGYNSSTKNVTLTINKRTINVTMGITGGATSPIIYNGNYYKSKAIVDDANKILDRDKDYVSIETENDSGTGAGEHTAVGVFREYVVLRNSQQAIAEGVSRYSNYKLSNATPSLENPFVWQITKATLTQDVIDYIATNSGFDGSTRSKYDSGELQKMTELLPVSLTMGETGNITPTGTDYKYYASDGSGGYATDPCSTAGVTEIGTYKVTVTYSFENIESITLTGYLNVVAPD